MNEAFFDRQNNRQPYMTEDASPRESAAYVFLTFLKLGCTSFGGPIAHIGYFRHEFVERRKWLDDKTYADLVALCNFLPGPASSQVGIAVGISRAGLAGGLAAWLGFTMPSALALILFAYGFTALGLSASAGWLHGLKIAAVAVVAQAVWNMGRNLCPDRIRASFAIAADTARLFRSKHLWAARRYRGRCNRRLDAARPGQSGGFAGTALCNRKAARDHCVGFLLRVARAAAARAPSDRLTDPGDPR
jgi:chromate transport protein ChrA